MGKTTYEIAWLVMPETCTPREDRYPHPHLLPFVDR